MVHVPGPVLPARRATRRAARAASRARAPLSSHPSRWRPHARGGVAVVGAAGDRAVPSAARAPVPSLSLPAPRAQSEESMGARPEPDATAAALHAATEMENKPPGTAPARSAPLFAETSPLMGRTLPDSSLNGPSTGGSEEPSTVETAYGKAAYS
jgi:hypothetical protein